MEQIFNNKYSEYAYNNGGKVLILFLLFSIAIYNLVKSGLPIFASICIIPTALIFILLSFKYKYFLLYTLMIINYFIMFFGRININIPGPASLPTELIEILLIIVTLIDLKNLKANFLSNIMTFAVIIWCTFCTLEILNDSCGIGIDTYRWFTGARLMAFQILYILIIVSLYINTPKKIEKFIFIWAILSLFAVIWVWKQRNYGFTEEELRFLYSKPANIVGGKIRYFSCFTDAANFGINMAASAVTFIIIGITSKIKRHKIFFLITGLLCIWAMFTSGTRTAIFVLSLGFIVFVFLSKSLRISVSTAVFFGTFLFILAFTKIGNGNDMMRRMRTAFDKNDASASVRDFNKDAISKYMKDAPWGIGIGAETGDVPAKNKFKILTSIPPDSEYVYIWVRTGKIGISVFVITTIIMFLGACFTVFLKIKNSSLRGLGAGLTSSFIALHLGGYANQILMQFPNVILFYGGLAIVYILPLIENEYNEYENKLIEEQEERKRIKEEKKRAKRV